MEKVGVSSSTTTVAAILPTEGGRHWPMLSCPMSCFLLLPVKFSLLLSAQWSKEMSLKNFSWCASTHPDCWHITEHVTRTFFPHPDLANLSHQFSCL